MSRYMTKPTQWVCVQRRLRSAWASAQSDQSLHCPHEETLGPYLPNKRTAKTLMTLIRLGGCLGWSESSLGAYSLCWFCHVVAHIIIIFAWFIARQSHYIYFLGSRKKSKLKLNNRETIENLHSNSTWAKFVNKIPCFMRKYLRVKHISK